MGKVDFFGSVLKTVYGQSKNHKSYMTEAVL